VNNFTLDASAAFKTTMYPACKLEKRTLRAYKLFQLLILVTTAATILFLSLGESRRQQHNETNGHVYFAGLGRSQRATKPITHGVSGTSAASLLSRSPQTTREENTRPHTVHHSTVGYLRVI